jgi:hypothetical protein
MTQFKAPFKIKLESDDKYNEMLHTFQEMLDGWKYKKEGRDYKIKEDKENLTIEVQAFSN